METKEFLAALGDALEPSRVVLDPDITSGFSRDMMPLAPSGTPLAVVFPIDTAEVAAIVKLCAAARIPIVPRGAGSGLTGAANAVDGAVTMVMTRMNAILEIDQGNRLAVVQPGVVNLDFRTAVESCGLFYAPDPSSYDWCTIGGNLSTNAGGLCCVKYGVTTDAVLGLEVVLASGEVLRTGRRTVKGVAGYDLTKLLVGSEGTLCIITEATLALRPKPAAPVTLVAAFASTEAAGEAVSGAIRAGLVPSLLEIMDATCIRAVEAKHGTKVLGDGETPAALLIGQSDAGAGVGRREMDELEVVCLRAGATFAYVTDDLAEGRMLLQARRDVLSSLEMFGTWLTDDVSVPRTRIAELISACEKISAQVGLTIGVVGHAGDGNMHPTIVYDAADPAQAAAAELAFGLMLDAGRALGGTVTGEHGVGRIKQDFLAREIGPVGLDLHRRIKNALDPDGLFNPGSMFTEAPTPAG
ncbi:glycolate oxidase [Nakamurella panacisegetis]|uniref:Glycolate oxidase n=1 Tax=Nakamurella panacisegetis TaxID=1090615 RepID=A0A1H0JU97_9ACTN|nr:FAD-linked oxidase C-terminal domain-containing protein [Nakamurella panacisegetis]SDO47072.1 glycolate oxidase [Nakamurella panacisegetis]